MLTDRQNKLVLDIQNLTSKLDEGPERHYLWKAWDKLMDGEDFKSTINQLCLNLKELERYPVGLSQGAKELLEKMIVMYGEPVGKPKKDWYVLNSDPDLIFQARGWTSRKGLEKQREHGCVRSIISVIAMLAFSIIFLSVIWSPLIPWVESKVGNQMGQIIVVIILLLILSILILTGNLVGKRRRNKL